MRNSRSTDVLDEITGLISNVLFITGTLFIIVLSSIYGFKGLLISLLIVSAVGGFLALSLTKIVYTIGKLAGRARR